MYCANARASLPVSITLPATEVVGSLMLAGSPAFFASAAIAAGVMSGVPTRNSCLRLELTVERPPAPMMIAAMPNATSTAAATTPPISKIFLILDTSFTATPCLRVFSGVSAEGVEAPSGERRRVAAGFPRGLRGETPQDVREDPAVAEVLALARGVEADAGGEGLVVRTDGHLVRLPVLHSFDRIALAAGEAEALAALAVAELEREDPRHQEVRAVDPLVALGDNCLDAEE